MEFTPAHIQNSGCLQTSFTLNNHAKEVDLTEKIELDAPAPEFPVAPAAEVPADQQ